MKTTTEYIKKLEALKAYLVKEENFTEEETAEATYNECCDSFECGGWEYKVLTDEEADEATREEILGNLWAFNADFILRHTKFFETSTDREDQEFILALQALQSRICESANPIVEALIEDKESFVEDAIDADGRGHFLSFYDGEEIEMGEFYAYRIN